MARILLAALLTTSLAIGCRATGVQAGGLIQKLPQDGAWAKYHVAARKVEENGQTEEHSSTFTISSVGTLILCVD